MYTCVRAIHMHVWCISPGGGERGCALMEYGNRSTAFLHDLTCCTCTCIYMYMQYMRTLVHVHAVHENTCSSYNAGSATA